MSEKNLLKEGTVRRFMKLAGTSVLSGDFLAEGSLAGDDSQDENVVQEQEEEPEDIELAAAEEDPEAELDLEPGADVEMDVEDELDTEPEGPEEEPEELVRKMVDAIAGVAAEFGVDVEVGEEEAPEVEVPPMEAGEEEELDIGEEPPEEEEEEEALTGEPLGEPEGLEEINYIDEDFLMNEVYHRVKNRLVKEKRADDVATKLAERISRRLNKRRAR